jgi:hypothetical protein
VSARFNEALQGAFGHVRGTLRRCKIATKNETTNIAYGILDEQMAMPPADRLALARALVPEHATELATLRAENARLREALGHYADTYCEGWCKEAGGTFDDCGGCHARAALAPQEPGQ